MLPNVVRVACISALGSSWLQVQPQGRPISVGAQPPAHCPSQAIVHGLPEEAALALPSSQLDHDLEIPWFQLCRATGQIQVRILGVCVELFVSLNQYNCYRPSI